MSCKWISAREMAQHLGVTKRSVIGWAKAGKLTYVQFGRQYFICKTVPPELVKSAKTLINEDYTPEVPY